MNSRGSTHRSTSSVTTGERCFTYRVATTRGDLLRSWTADIANGVHPDVKWHQYARIWQTPDEGEAYFKAVHETPLETMAEAYREFSSRPRRRAHAGQLVRRHDGHVHPRPLSIGHAERLSTSWGAQFGPTSAPGLILFAELDSFGNEAMSKDVAEDLRRARGDAGGRRALVGARGPGRGGRGDQGVHPLDRLSRKARNAVSGCDAPGRRPLTTRSSRSRVTAARARMVRAGSRDRSGEPCRRRN